MEIRKLGSKVIPSVEFKDLEDVKRDKQMLGVIRKRGAVLVKGVIGEGEALEMKEQVREYIKKNQSRVKGSYFIKLTPAHLWDLLGFC